MHDTWLDERVGGDTWKPYVSHHKEGNSAKRGENQFGGRKEKKEKKEKREEGNEGRAEVLP